MDRQTFLHNLQLRDIALSAGFLAVSLLGVSQSTQIVGDLLLLTGTVTAPLTRRKWPLPTTMAALILLTTAAVLPGLSIAVIVLAGFTSYVVRRHLPPLSRTITSVTLALGTLIALALVAPALTALPIPERIPYVTWGVTFLIACGLLGELRRRSLETAQRELQQELDRQRSEFEQVTLEQRSYIAREIHDIVTHSLTIVVAQADGGLYSAAPDTGTRLQQKDEALRAIATIGRESLRQMRGVVGLLHASETRPTSPQVGYSDIPRLVGQSRAAGLDIDFTIEGDPPGEVPAAVSLTLYRLVQEALTNAHKHGNPTVRITLSWALGEATVYVANPIAHGAALAHHGHGLNNMRERVDLLGGVFTAGPSGKTWVLEATLPLPREDSARGLGDE